MSTRPVQCPCWPDRVFKRPQARDGSLTTHRKFVMRHNVRVYQDRKRPFQDVSRKVREQCPRRPSPREGLVCRYEESVGVRCPSMKRPCRGNVRVCKNHAVPPKHFVIFPPRPATPSRDFRRFLVQRTLILSKV